MATQHVSLRLKSETIDRLDFQSRREGQSRSETARTLIEEGLRMADHPGIVFRPGPAGRRPALSYGPDVWELARFFLRSRATGEELVRHTAEVASLRPEQVRIAMRYYAEFSDEIDEWIKRADDEANRAEAAWLREQELLAR